MLRIGCLHMWYQARALRARRAPGRPKKVNPAKSPRSKSNGIYDVPTLLSGWKYAALRFGS
jgi:hypothetical protein